MHRRYLHRQTTPSLSWISTISLFSLLLSSPSSRCLASATPSAYHPAVTAPAAAPPPSRTLHKRQAQSTGGSQCLANFYSCSSQGPAFNGVCCAINQICALDAGNQPACCPVNAVCTGTAPATFVMPTGIAGPVSYVPNAYAFSFPYIATVFANPGACSAAASQCTANAAACTSQLQGQAGGAAAGGGSYGVTIAVPGPNGGASQTVIGNAGAPAVTMDPSRAATACASLSSAACYGIQPGVCTVGNSGVFSVGNAASGAERGVAALGRRAAAVSGIVGAVVGAVLI